MNVRKLPDGPEYYDDEVGAAKGHARSGSKGKARQTAKRNEYYRKSIRKTRRKIRQGRREFEE